MKDVLINYKITVPGFFFSSTFVQTEIVKLKDGETIGEAVKRDFKRWTDQFRDRSLTICIVDFKEI